MVSGKTMEHHQVFHMAKVQSMTLSKNEAKNSKEQLLLSSERTLPKKKKKKKGPFLPCGSRNSMVVP
jgi:hypothetical protein